MSGWFRTYGLADVADDLLIGAYPLDADDVRVLERLGVRRVLNLVQDSEYGPGERDTVAAALRAAGIEEHRHDLVDYGGLPADRLEAAARQVGRWLDEGVRTYVHCRAGWQRSAAVAAAVVALREGLDIDSALAVVQMRKPTADPLPHQREDLRAWWVGRRGAAGAPGGAGGAGSPGGAGGAGGPGDPDRSGAR